ncbi:unnamed protein product [Hermetia illucens]|uniref:Protein-lysine N-methyltransferase SMYD4 n=1 Tax=Hermetia illucens TaxID=343691 RepID=A0A7R8U9R1_HERIL|nr:unnamed protein product [Hermetia illucens]
MDFASYKDWDKVLDIFLDETNGSIFYREAYHFKNEVDTTRLVHCRKIRRYLKQWIDSRRDNVICDEILSEAIRNQGNDAFQNPRTVDIAAALYTKAIYAAPLGTQAIALAHGNRAAAVYKLGQYEAAYYDCEYALKFDHPKRKMILMRQATCAQSLADASKLENCIEQLEKLNLSEREIADYKKSLIDKRASPLPVPSAKDELLPEKKQRILKTHRRGRYVVADESISENETIMSEEPFAFVPIVSVDHDSIHYICDGCAESDIVPFPCYGCRFAFYCGPKCREKQEPIHRFECSGNKVNLFGEVGIAYLALRCLLVVFNSLLEEVRQRKGSKTIQTAEELWPVILETGRDASLLCCYLIHKTTFMEETRSARRQIMQSNSEWEIILASLLLRLINQMICNAHTIDQTIVKGFTGDGFRLGYLSEAAQNSPMFSAIYPRVSLYNHACEPSFRNKFEKAKLVVIASKDIDKGKEIFNCYGPKWISDSRDERRSLLRLQYGFTCNCVHCRDSKDTGYFAYNHVICKADGCGGRFLLHQPCPSCGLAYDNRFYARIIDSVTVIENTIRKYKYLHELFWKMSCYLPRYTRLRSSSAKFILSTFLRSDNAIKYNEKLTRRMLSIAVDLAESAEKEYGCYHIDYIYRSSFLLDLIAIRNQQGFEPVPIEYDLNKIKRAFNELPFKLKKKFDNYFDLNII